MPTYSYKCTQCDHAFDIQQAFTDDSLTICPQCGGPLRKVFGTVGVTFNGSGFYRTDSRSENKKGGKKSTSDSSKGSGEGASVAAGKSSGEGSKSPAPSASSGSAGSSATGAGTTKSPSSGKA